MVKSINSASLRTMIANAAMLIVIATFIVTPATAQTLPIDQGKPASVTTAYVTNSAAGTVTVIDVSSHAVLAVFAVGGNPVKPVLSPDGTRAYLPNYVSGELSVVDTTTHTLTGSISIPNGTAVVAPTPDGTRLYVGGANETISVLDATLGTVINTFAIGPPDRGTVYHMVISPDGSRAYALLDNNSLVAIDTATDTVVNSIYVGDQVNHVAIAPDGTEIYVTNSFGYGDFTFQGAMVVVDPISLTVTNEFPFSLPTSIALTPNGDHAYVATPYAFFNSGYGQGYASTPYVQVVNLHAIGNLNAASIFVGGQPADVACSSDGDRVYVAVPRTQSIKVIDTTNQTIVDTIELTFGPGWVTIIEPR
jgi:YVTN family beta-propeller protein